MLDKQVRSSCFTQLFVELLHTGAARVKTSCSLRLARSEADATRGMLDKQVTHLFVELLYTAIYRVALHSTYRVALHSTVELLYTALVCDRRGPYRRGQDVPPPTRPRRPSALREARLTPPAACSTNRCDRVALHSCLSSCHTPRYNGISWEKSVEKSVRISVGPADVVSYRMGLWITK